MEMYNEYREQERMKEMIQDREKLLSYTKAPYHLSPDERIDPRWYSKDATPEEQQKLEHHKYNMLRRTWFTSVLGDIQFVEGYLSPEKAKYVREKYQQLRQKVIATETNIDVESVHEALKLIHEAVFYLNEIIDPQSHIEAKENLHDQTDLAA